MEQLKPHGLVESNSLKFSGDVVALNVVMAQQLCDDLSFELGVFAQGHITQYFKYFAQYFKSIY